MDETIFRKEVASPPSKTWRLALFGSALLSCLSLGLSLATLRAPARVVVETVPAVAPPMPACGMVLSATVARASLAGVEGDAVLRNARLVPVMGENGGYGFRIFAIRPGSLPDMIGLQNGDTILRVQGIPITSAASALAATRAVRAAHSVTVNLLRRGCPVAIVVGVA